MTKNLRAGLWKAVLTGCLMVAGSEWGHAAEGIGFVQAEPVWAEAREKEKNLTLGYTAEFERPAWGNTVVRATGATLYRVYLNGVFVGHGPARGPHGYYRVDEWDVSERLKPGRNQVAFEVAGYNANSYYLLDQPSFLQAEVSCAGQVLAATRTGTGQGEGKSFAARVLPERVQKVQRYSFQRPFSEVYRLRAGWSDWRTGKGDAGQGITLAAQGEKKLLPRRVKQPEYFRRQPVKVVGEGTLKRGVKVEQPWRDRSLTEISARLGGYPEQELASVPSLELQTVGVASNLAVEIGYMSKPGLELKTDEFRIVDLGCNLTGFIGQRVLCERKTRLAVSFDEVLSDGDVDFKRLSCVNAVVYELEPGSYDLETFEPYTLRYLKLMVLEGECRVEGIYLRELACPDVEKAEFACSDERLNRLFVAGRETFRQNATDIFMDCPSRERAGWLCDSYFTARVAKDLCGDTVIERNFLENFRLPERFEHLPEGMLPMCYPADHNDGVFIPNWALWFVVELEEYWQRSGDREMVEGLRGRVLGLLKYFEKFRNSDGLLEKLASWVFVEWSAANSFVQDVNYPSNMLFARALTAAGRMYDLPELARDGERVRERIRAQAWDGEFFVDNAVRREGTLQVTTNRTEVCQYFAFYFGVATPETHAVLWQRLRDDFGPRRKQTKKFAEVHPANAFIGNVLRLELLSRNGLTRQLLDESVAYQLHMAERTGTLWEHDGAYASCNHGFASHGGVHVLYRDVLGLREVDWVKKRVVVRYAECGLEWCRGVAPTPDGPVSVNWRKVDGQVRFDVNVPAGWVLDREK